MRQRRSRLALALACVHTASCQHAFADPVLCELNSTMCGRYGTNNTDGCRLLFVDIGANVGQSLHQWYHSSDTGHGMKEYAKVASWKTRRTYCADVFEGNPAFNGVLRREAAYHRSRVRHHTTPPSHRINMRVSRPAAIGQRARARARLRDHHHPGL